MQIHALLTSQLLRGQASAFELAVMSVIPRMTSLKAQALFVGLSTIDEVIQQEMDRIAAEAEKQREKQDPRRWH